MTGIYGTRFLRDFGESVPDAWRLAIQRITDAELERGFRRLLDAGGDHPPNLAQFTKLCRDVADHDGPAPPSRRALPAPIYDRFHCFAGRQLWKFLRVRDVPAKAMPEILRRKNEIITAARVDPDMQPGGDEVEQGKALHEILWAAWEKVLTTIKKQEAQKAA